MSAFKRDNILESTKSKALPPIKRYDRPQSVAELAVGHVVIAFESDEVGWWEAIILERDEDQFTLAWDGCPDQPTFKRSQYQVALLCPTGAKQAA